MFYEAAKFVLKIYYRIFFHLTVEGENNIPLDGGVVICANHTSLYDPITVGINMKRSINYMAKKELFDVVGLKTIIRCLHAFPVDRSGNDLSAIKMAVNLLKNGEVLGIFAQGKRVKDGEEASAKAGVALIAMKSEVPVVPANIKSEHKMFGKIKIIYGEPMTFPQYAGQRLKSNMLAAVAEEIMCEINRLGSLE